MIVSGVPPQADLGFAIALAKTLDSAMAPLFVAAVIGVMGWATWISWTVRSINQTVKNIVDSMKSVTETVSDVRDELEDHRRDDAKSFGKLEERTGSLLDRILDRARLA